MSPEEALEAEFRAIQEKCFRTFLEVTNDLALLVGREPAELLLDFLKEKMGKAQ